MHWWDIYLWSMLCSDCTASGRLFTYVGWDWWLIVGCSVVIKPWDEISAAAYSKEIKFCLLTGALTGGYITWKQLILDSLGSTFNSSLLIAWNNPIAPIVGRCCLGHVYLSGIVQRSTCIRFTWPSSSNQVYILKYDLNIEILNSAWAGSCM